jgi:hypothetical protein
MSELDPIIETLLLLKNNWSLTGDLSSGSITWSTGFYDSSVQFPQIVISQLGGDPTPPLTIGASDAYYTDSDIMGIGIWIRPKQDSNTSFGWAKNAIYRICREVERIVRSGSDLGQDVNGYERLIYLGPWRRDPLLEKRPVLLHVAATARIVKTVKGV